MQALRGLLQVLRRNINGQIRGRAQGFQQLANFGVADIARVNAELKEFKGRMEQDDWIGQAKELLFKKHSGAESDEDRQEAGFH